MLKRFKCYWSRRRGIFRSCKRWLHTPLPPSTNLQFLDGAFIVNVAIEVLDSFYQGFKLGFILLHCTAHFLLDQTLHLQPTTVIKFRKWTPRQIWVFPHQKKIWVCVCANKPKTKAKSLKPHLPVLTSKWENLNFLWLVPGDDGGQFSILHTERHTEKDPLQVKEWCLKTMTVKPGHVSKGHIGSLRALQ